MHRISYQSRPNERTDGREYSVMSLIRFKFNSSLPSPDGWLGWAGLLGWAGWMGLAWLVVYLPTYRTYILRPVCTTNTIQISQRTNERNPNPTPLEPRKINRKELELTKKKTPSLLYHILRVRLTILLTYQPRYTSGKRIHTTLPFFPNYLCFLPFFPYLYFQFPNFFSFPPLVSHVQKSNQSSR